MELLVLKDVHELGEMIKVFFLTLALNQNVIKVNHRKLPNEWPKQLVY